MGSWTKVKWTEAGQITALLEWSAESGQNLSAAPEEFFRNLRAAGRLDEAAMFLGQALPRYEVVAWAARVLQELKPAKSDQTPQDLQALASAKTWLQDPTEPHRRAAFAASSSAADRAPERFTALAAFFSGGAMSPEDCPPVPAPRDSAGKFASAAVILAATRTADRSGALARALDLGAALASGDAPLAST